MMSLPNFACFFDSLFFLVFVLFAVHFCQRQVSFFSGLLDSRAVEIQPGFRNSLLGVPFFKQLYFCLTVSFNLYFSFKDF